MQNVQHIKFWGVKIDAETKATVTPPKDYYFYLSCCTLCCNDLFPKLPAPDKLFSKDTLNEPGNNKQKKHSVLSVCTSGVSLNDINIINKFL